MQTAEIRRRFLDFFAAPRAHGRAQRVAGVARPEPALHGRRHGAVHPLSHRPGDAAVQACRRACRSVCGPIDIEEVGKTTRHATFFQMNGNFSFGDYFKEDAIEFAWELVTASQDDRWVRLRPRHHLGDRLSRRRRGRRVVEAGRRAARRADPAPWRQGQLLAHRPARAGRAVLGDLCRPQPGARPDGGPVADEDRYLEIWNLVFMQEAIDSVRSKEDFRIVADLPSRNIDTGMGLERVAYLLQGVDNLYEIDEVYPVLDRACGVVRVRYGADDDDDVRLRVVADHVRSGLMLIGEGVDTLERGPRLRRAAAATPQRADDAAARGRRPVLPELLPVSMAAMQGSYPEVERDFDRIAEIAYAEEETFRSTLAHRHPDLRPGGDGDQGGRQQHTRRRDGVPAARHATGSPIDLTLEMAAEQGLSVDEGEFRRLMTEQRDRAKADARARRRPARSTCPSTDRAGRRPRRSGRLHRVRRGHRRRRRSTAWSWRGRPRSRPSEGDDVDVVLDRTPFYAEGGGQLADQGVIEVAGGGRSRCSTSSPR